MKKEMLINVLQPEECRIAILEDGILEELYVERTGHESYVGNIYKGKIVNIEPSIQAAFVDFGVGRNGFLHVSDVEPTYWRQAEQQRRGGDRGDRMERFEREERFDRPPPRQDRQERPPQREPQRQREREPQRERERERPAKRVREEVAELPPSTDFAAGVDLPPLALPVDLTSEFPPPLPTEPPPLPEEYLASFRSVALPPLVANPETLIEEDPGRPRRRSRNAHQRRQRRTDGPSDEGAPPADEPPAEQPKPRLMDSAERRTDKGDDSDSHRLDFDPDLFFPSAPSETSRPADEPVEAIEIEEIEEIAEIDEVETVEEPDEPVLEDIEIPEATIEVPKPTHRPRRVDRHASIEAALAADLAEAEIGEEALLNVGEPIAEDNFDDDLDDFGGIDEGDDFLPPRRDHRDNRGGRGGRDQRGGGGGRRPGTMGGRPGAGRPRPLIQDIFKRGQEVIVQVIKEGIGTKGPTLSTYISIPGRYLVLMPCLNRTGVSRKIEDDDARRRLRQMFNELRPPNGLGFIMRTAAIDKNKKEVQRDLVYLCRLWQVVAKRIRKMKAPGEIYQESEMVTRTIRDNFTSDIDTIWVDEKNAFEAAQEFMQVVMPRFADRIKHFDAREPIFQKFGIEDEIQRIQLKKVPLPEGGSIVIEQTEALVAIDVNSGNFRADNNAEETAFRMNLLAAKEIARQLRLRDLGGVIVNDFIDMREEKHRRGVEKALRDAMRRDRARTKILKISQFGIIEMTRQRIRPSLKRSGYMDCPYCKATGMVKTPETMAIEIMRLLQTAACREAVVRIEVKVPQDVADYLLNKKRKEIVQLEETGQMAVTVRMAHGAAPEHLEFMCLDRNDNEVRLNAPEPYPYRARRDDSRRG